MEQQIKREVATQTAAAGKAAAPRKRDVAAAPKKAGLTTQDLILIAVLLAAGAVLKLTVGSLLSSMGMKPNFIIAMYCLAIILTRPKLGQALIIGLLAGLICQIPLLNATPLLNIPSRYWNEKFEISIMGSRLSSSNRRLALVSQRGLSWCPRSWGGRGRSALRYASPRPRREIGCHDRPQRRQVPRAGGPRNPPPSASAPSSAAWPAPARGCS